MNIKQKFIDLETWFIHKEAIRHMKRRYKTEVAALRISENYLTDLINGYQQEDSQRSKWRDALLQTQRDILNLEMLLKFLNKIK